MKKLLVIILAVLVLAFAGCSAEKSGGTDTNGLNVTDANGNAVESKNGIVTITKPGTYTVSGEAEEGQLIVECHSAGDVTIVLNNVSVACSTSAPIYVKEAEKTIIELAAGTENTVTDNRNRVEEEPNAAIFSHDDLKINGEGSLNVYGNKNNGITSKDKLTIENGVINVYSDNHGIRGKDRLKIENGVITVEAGYDGLRATNDTEADRGEVLVENGVITITAGDDAIYAYNMVNIENGAFSIKTENNAVKAENSVTISGGTFDITSEDKDFVCASLTVSSAAEITVNGEKQTY